jgi:uncharacterized membrane protein HdeD (DUF308 family)
MNKSL